MVRALVCWSLSGLGLLVIIGLGLGSRGLMVDRFAKPCTSVYCSDYDPMLTASHILNIGPSAA